MAATATPYGARPVGTSNGTYNGAVTEYNIASGYATNIFYGDFVKGVAAGTVEKDTGTATLTPIGIFLGCKYTDPNSKTMRWSQYWPASTVASDAKAFVADDPDLEFLIQAGATVAQTALFANAGVTQTAGSTLTGNSKVTLDAATVATTATLPIRILGFPDSPQSAVGDAFTDVRCRFNAGHQKTNTTGI